MPPTIPSQAPSMFMNSLVTTVKPGMSKLKAMLIITSISLHVTGGVALFAASLMSFEVL